MKLSKIVEKNNICFWLGVGRLAEPEKVWPCRFQTGKFRNEQRIGQNILNGSVPLTPLTGAYLGTQGQTVVEG